MPKPTIPSNFGELKYFLSSKTGLHMAHIYKPTMLLAIMRAGGRASKEYIAKEFVLKDSSQIDYYRRVIVHKMPGKRLIRDGLVAKDKDIYSLSGAMARLSSSERKEIEEILESRISDYLKVRNPYGDSNLDAVPGSTRFEVLRRSGGRCELCGVSSKKTQIDVDHIVPRAKGGSNDISNLQALCRTCNSQKRDRDSTDFRQVHSSYEDREPDCPFCESGDRVVEQNDLAYLMNDKYPVSKAHALVIPKRHVSDYFDLHMAERNAIESLLICGRDLALSNDPSISGFNIGVNVGETAGQTVPHVHIHLIPRRNGDVENPRGGVRHIIPGAGDYLAGQ